MYVSDEEIQVITESAGSIYNYWSNLFGSDNANSSYDFILNQTIDFLNNRKIRYTINLENELLVTQSDEYILNVSSGNIINSSNSLIKFSGESASLAHLYSYNYDANGYYGVVVGINYSDIESTSVVERTYLSQDVDSGDKEIYVNDTSVFENYSFPVYIQIKDENILIDSINESLSYVSVSDDYNGGDGVINSFLENDNVFVYSKINISITYGAPVSEEYVPIATAQEFKYYPPTSDTMMVLAKILVRYPVTPETYNRNEEGSGLDHTTIISIDDSFRTIGSESEDIPFTSDQLSAIYNYYDLMSNMKNFITYNTALYSMCNSLNNIEYEDIVEYQWSGSSFQNYWNHRPMKRASYLSYGVQWDDFERFEFSEGFKKLWYDWSEGEQLLTTLCVFSGNLMDSRFTSGVTAPEITSIEAIEVESPSLGAISPGTWSYSVTVVTNSGESPLSEFANVSIPINKTNNKIEINWDEIPGALYYNVYRKASNSYIVNDLRLTSEGQITTNSFTDIGDTLPEDTTTTKRGIVLTGKEIYSSEGSSLYYCIPLQRDTNSILPIQSLQDSIEISDDTTQNGIILTLDLEKPDGSVEAIEITIPSGTSLGTSTIINDGEKYSKLIDAKVSLIEDDFEMVGSRVNWSYKDVVVIQNIQ
jgi:hypothetical protein